MVNDLQRWGEVSCVSVLCVSWWDGPGLRLGLDAWVGPGAAGALALLVPSSSSLCCGWLTGRLVADIQASLGGAEREARDARLGRA